MAVTHLELTDGTKIKVKEGKLAPHKEQALYWLVEGKWAIGRVALRDDNWNRPKDDPFYRLEVFRAIKHREAACGYQFSFAYTTTCLESLSRRLCILREDKGRKDKFPEESLINTLCKFSFEDPDNKPIDRGWLRKPVFSL